MPLAARIDDVDRRPQAVPPHPRVPVVEPPWAQGHSSHRHARAGEVFGVDGGGGRVL